MRGGAIERGECPQVGVDHDSEVAYEVKIDGG